MYIIYIIIIANKIKETRCTNSDCKYYDSINKLGKTIYFTNKKIDNIYTTKNTQVHYTNDESVAEVLGVEQKRKEGFLRKILNKILKIEDDSIRFEKELKTKKEENSYFISYCTCIDCGNNGIEIKNSINQKGEKILDLNGVLCDKCGSKNIKSYEDVSENGRPCPYCRKRGINTILKYSYNDDGPNIS